MNLIQTSVGRKFLMAITGFMMFGFVAVHLIGNSTVYFDGINAYAEHLHALGPLVWIFRLVMLGTILIHVFFGIRLTLENREASPTQYAIVTHDRANFSSKSMIYTGLGLLAFIVYHLLHFTVHVTNPEISVGHIAPDVLGRPDVMFMVVKSFQQLFIVLLYIFAMFALLLHLKHGIASLVQTIGWTGKKSLPIIETVGTVIAAFFLLGFIAIPISIILGIVTV